VFLFATKTNLLYLPMVAKKIKNEEDLYTNLELYLREEKLLKKKKRAARAGNIPFLEYCRNSAFGKFGIETFDFLSSWHIIKCWLKYKNNFTSILETCSKNTNFLN